MKFLNMSKVTVAVVVVMGLNLGRLQYRTPIHDPDASKVRLTGLSPDTYYRVYLSAATAQGGGEHIFLDMKTTPSERKCTPRRCD